MPLPLDMEALPIRIYKDANVPKLNKPSSPFSRFLREASLDLDAVKSRLQLCHECSNSSDWTLARQQFDEAGQELQKLLKDWDKAAHLISAHDTPGAIVTDTHKQPASNPERSLTPTPIVEPTLFEGEAAQVTNEKGPSRVRKVGGSPSESDRLVS